MAEDSAPDGNTQDDEKVHALYDVQVEITAVLGTADMPISQILKLGRGAVVELNRSVGENIEIHANNRLVAKGEVVVVEDRLGVTLTDVLKIGQTLKQ
jgi:flagellar motor switch protein FliN/FliY